MEPEITPEQKAYLETWAGKRDALILEVSSLQTQKEKLEAGMKETAESYSDLVTRANQIIGRLIELDRKEKERSELLLKEIAPLESQKTLLQNTVTNLTDTVKSLEIRKTSLENDVSSALSTFNIVKGESLILDKVIDRVTKFSEQNTNEVNTLVSNLKISLEELIGINKKNVAETNTVLDKLPKMLVELQRVKLIKNKI